MATLEITARDTFSHGRLRMERGDKETIEASEARDLAKAGLVTIEDIAPQTGITDSEDNLDDLVGGEKMEEAPQNKMAPAPANKKAR